MLYAVLFKSLQKGYYLSYKIQQRLKSVIKSNGITPKEAVKRNDRSDPLGIYLIHRVYIRLLCAKYLLKTPFCPGLEICL